MTPFAKIIRMRIKAMKILWMTPITIIMGPNVGRLVARYAERHGPENHETGAAQCNT